MDRTPFYGGRIPLEIKGMIKPLKCCDKQTFRKILQVLVLSMEGKPVDSNSFSSLVTEQLNEEAISFIYAGLYKLLQLAIRTPPTLLKAEAFKEDLAQLKIAEDYATDLASVVFGSKRQAIEQNSQGNKPSLPRLDNFRWRVDVGISTSVLQRALEPSVLMELTLSDGKKHQMEVTIEKFHQLRYSTAVLLKAMEDLEKRSILKVES